MKTLFDSTYIKNMNLKNRLVRSATYEGLAKENGYMNEELFDIYEELAKGDVGLIITSYAYITKEEQPNPRMMGIYEDGFIKDYKPLVDMIHSYDSNVVMQLVYGGSNTTYNTDDRIILGPSSVEQMRSGVIPKEMNKEDIDYIIKSFANAAYRCKQAGFDGVQIHAAHGYLYSQFLDPRHNQRSDEYGGSIENRARIIFETLYAIREKVGNDYHIGIKINCSDFREDGLKFEECLWVCEQLDNIGIDSIEVSGGDFRSFQDESFFRDYAANISEKVNCNVILVGGNKSVDTMENILNNTNIEYFSICRGLICEPDLVKKFKDNKEYKIKCVNCNGCLKDRKLKCLINK